MSEDGLADGFEEPIMEIQIKTLMGTTFDIKVSSMDTVEDIKKKIYRIEGIPIYQQNLIFQSSEMQNTSRLGDAGITNGSVLTLVTSMKGGPISTKRLSVTCEHIMLKELKELLENTREDISPGSKVSVLVFKEGDIINLLRVIENDDGSYSPYSEKPISPPMKATHREPRMDVFERLVEDTEMSNKIANLRKKMDEVNIRKKHNTNKTNQQLDIGFTNNLSNSYMKSNSLAFKFLSQCGNDLLDSIDLKIFEKNLEEESEEEIALKDKHRSNLHKLTKPRTKSFYSESKGACSQTKQSYTRIQKKSSETHSNSKEVKGNHEPQLASSRSELPTGLAEQLAALQDEEYSEAVSVANRIHLTRLVLSESSERPKSSANSIELEENAQDLWEIHEPASERLKHSATCKVGLLKRRQSVDYGYDGLEDTPKGDLGNYSCKNSNYEVCSSNFYHMPHLVSSPSAIPPQYAPKEDNLCDYYFKQEHSPLYGRSSKNDLISREDSKLVETKNEKFNFLGESSSIQRLKNESGKCDSLFSVHDQSMDELYEYYNLGCSTDLLGEKIVSQTSSEKTIELPPVIKKKARCGKIFCSQHRYSEVHRCSYNYKLAGRKILEKQNPLVTAEKVSKI